MTGGSCRLYSWSHVTINSRRSRPSWRNSMDVEKWEYHVHDALENHSFEATSVVGSISTCCHENRRVNLSDVRPLYIATTFSKYRKSCIVVLPAHKPVWHHPTGLDVDLKRQWRILSACINDPDAYPSCFRMPFCQRGQPSSFLILHHMTRMSFPIIQLDWCVHRNSRRESTHSRKTSTIWKWAWSTQASQSLLSTSYEYHLPRSSSEDWWLHSPSCRGVSNW